MKNKVLEAMACGLPVVGTREAFEGMDLHAGRDVAECPLERVPDEIVALLGDPSRRQALGQAGRQWVVENASWDEVARRFDELLCAGVRPAPSVRQEVIA